MPLQQQLSKQILLFKNKKLFYIITAFTQTVKKQTFDVLNFKQSIITTNTTKLVQQNLNCYAFQCNFNDFQTADFNQQVYFSSVTKIDQQLGLLTKNFVDSINLKKSVNSENQLLINDSSKHFFDYADNPQLYSNGVVYQLQQSIKVKDQHISDSQNVNKKTTAFDFHDQISIRSQKISYNNESLFQDYQNFLYVLNDNYKFKLYLDDVFLLNVNNDLTNGQLSKDIIFHACEQGLVYLKVYDINDNFIKSVPLKKTTQFDLIVFNVVYDKNKMSFYSNKHYLQGRNICHGNSICKTVFCNFDNKNNILYDDIRYDIVSHYNVNFTNGIWFDKNGFLVLRVYFDKLVYIKKIEQLSSISNSTFDVLYKCSSDKNIVKYVPYKKYNDDEFYCKMVQIKITYIGNILCKLQKLKIQLYDLQKQDIAKTPRFIYDQNNKIILNKRNIIDNVTKKHYGMLAKQQYPNYISGFNTNEYFELDNVKNSNTDYIEVDNEQQFACIRFGINKDALTGTIGQTTNNFRYVYLQYEIEEKESTTLFDFKNFQLLNCSKNFPKKLTMNYLVVSTTTTATLQFEHKISDSKIITDTKTGKPISFIQQWNCTTENYTGSYFYIAYSFVADDQHSQTSNWNTVVHLTIKQNQSILFESSSTVQQTAGVISFIQDNCSNGFNLFLAGTNYTMFKSQLQQPQILIYTNEYSESSVGQWENVGGNYVNTTDKLKRNIQIKIKDGQNKHVKLYSIVLKNHNNGIIQQVGSNEKLFYNEAPNQFLTNDLLYDFDLTGNNLIDKTDSKLYIENNFYNLMYCINYFYSSQKKGKIFQADQTYFDKSKYQPFNKSNLHIQWKQNDLFQYLILFDRFDNTKGNDWEKYQSYFLPFHQFYSIKTPDIQYCAKEQQKNIELIFQYSFEKTEIILEMIPNIKSISKIGIKYDYYYSYSDDYKLWSQYKYYYPNNAFYAKYVRVKCFVHSTDNTYYNYAKDLKLKYVDSDVYYLTDKNYFQSSYKMKLENDTKYMILIRKLYNSQVFDTTLKLFYIGESVLLAPITKIFVDDKQYIDHNLIISGVDNICKLSFQIVQIPKQLHIVLYKNNENNQLVQFKQYYTRQFKLQGNNIYSTECTLDENANKLSQLYACKVRYFNNNYQVSQFSYIAKFKFNNIPKEPYDLDVDNR